MPQEYYLRALQECDQIIKEIDLHLEIFPTESIIISQNLISTHYFFNHCGHSLPGFFQKAGNVVLPELPGFFIINTYEAFEIKQF